MERTDLALRKCDDLHAGKAEVFEKGSYVLLIPRQPIECFGNDYVESAKSASSF